MDTGNESPKPGVHAATGKSDYSKTPNQYVTVHGIKLAYRTIGYRTDAPALAVINKILRKVVDPFSLKNSIKS